MVIYGGGVESFCKFQKKRYSVHKVQKKRYHIYIYIYIYIILFFIGH